MPSSSSSSLSSSSQEPSPSEIDFDEFQSCASSEGQITQYNPPPPPSTTTQQQQQQSQNEEQSLEESKQQPQGIVTSRSLQIPQQTNPYIPHLPDTLIITTTTTTTTNNNNNNNNNNDYENNNANNSAANNSSSSSSLLTSSQEIRTTTLSSSLKSFLSSLCCYCCCCFRRCCCSFATSCCISSSFLEQVLFFGCGLGSSIGYIATLSALVYFRSIYGPNSFVYLNLAVYLPLLPISLAQAKWDQYYDVYYRNSRITFMVRGCIAYGMILWGTLQMIRESSSTTSTSTTPSAAATTSILSSSTTFFSSPSSLTKVIINATWQGTGGAILYGTLNQMASFVTITTNNNNNNITTTSSTSNYNDNEQQQQQQQQQRTNNNNNGSLKATVSAGVQASALLVLALSVLTGFSNISSNSMNNDDDDSSNNDNNNNNTTKTIENEFFIGSDYDDDDDDNNIFYMSIMQEQQQNSTIRLHEQEKFQRFLWTIVIVETICFIMFVWLLLFRPSIAASMLRRDYSLRMSEDSTTMMTRRRRRRNPTTTATATTTSIRDNDDGNNRNDNNNGNDNDNGNDDDLIIPNETFLDEYDENNNDNDNDNGDDNDNNNDIETPLLQQQQPVDQFETPPLRRRLFPTPPLSPTNTSGREQQPQQQITSTAPSSSFELSYWELWKYTKLHCLVLMVTLIPSFLVGSWFTRVETNFLQLAQILFYVRIAADFIGRLATINSILPPKSITCLIWTSFLRFVPVISFFFNSKQKGPAEQLLLYNQLFGITTTTTATTTTSFSSSFMENNDNYYSNDEIATYIFHDNNNMNDDDNNNNNHNTDDINENTQTINDYISIVLVAIIAFQSGYLVTGCFQLAPQELPIALRESNQAKQASLLTVFFSISAILGLASSFTLIALGV